MQCLSFTGCTWLVGAFVLASVHSAKLENTNCCGRQATHKMTCNGNEPIYMHNVWIRPKQRILAAQPSAALRISGSNRQTGPEDGSADWVLEAEPLSLWLCPASAGCLHALADLVQSATVGVDTASPPPPGVRSRRLALMHAHSAQLAICSQGCIPECCEAAVASGRTHTRGSGAKTCGSTSGCMSRDICTHICSCRRWLSQLPLCD